MENNEMTLASDIQELNDYLYLDSRRYDNVIGGEEWTA